MIAHPAPGDLALRLQFEIPARMSSDFYLKQCFRALVPVNSWCSSFLRSVRLFLLMRLAQGRDPVVLDAIQ